MASERDAWLDNIKAVLVTFVVIGHFVASGAAKMPEYAFVSNFVYTFHMPAFLFVSGYLMKRRIAERSFSKVGKSIVLPYCTSQIFVFLFACVFPDGISALSVEKMSDGGFFSLLYPIYHLWYFIAVAVGFLFCVAVKSGKRPCIALLLSVCLSIGAGFLKNADFLRITKCVGYLPFLVLGAVIPEKAVNFIKTKRITALPGAVCFFGTAVFLWLIREKGRLTTIFAMTGKFGNYMGISAPLAALIRLGFLVWGGGTDVFRSFDVSEKKDIIYIYRRKQCLRFCASRHTACRFAPCELSDKVYIRTYGSMGCAACCYSCRGGSRAYVFKACSLPL